MCISFSCTSEIEQSEGGINIEESEPSLHFEIEETQKYIFAPPNHRVIMANSIISYLSETCGCPKNAVVTYDNGLDEVRAEYGLIEMRYVFYEFENVTVCHLTNPLSLQHFSELICSMSNEIPDLFGYIQNSTDDSNSCILYQDEINGNDKILGGWTKSNESFSLNTSEIWTETPYDSSITHFDIQIDHEKVNGINSFDHFLEDKKYSISLVDTMSNGMPLDLGFSTL